MLLLNFFPFPNLSSERLHFRRLTIDDAQEIFELRSNPETMKYIPRPLAITTDDALKHINLINENIDKNTAINWAITEKNNDKCIGIIGFFSTQPENFRTELGYMLLPEYHNKGYVTESVKTLLNYAFHTLNFNSIEATINPDNVASEKVLQKNGFVKEAHLIENFYHNGKFIDSVIYSLLKRNYKK